MPQSCRGFISAVSEAAEKNIIFKGASARCEMANPVVVGVLGWLKLVSRMTVIVVLVIALITIIATFLPAVQLGM